MATRSGGLAVICRRIVTAVLVLASSQVFAADIIINQLRGFDDETAAAPVGGNSGTTIGEQRLQVFEKAAEMWAQNLSLKVDLVVDAEFVSLNCSSGSAVLGSAAAKSLYADFPNAPVANTYYHVALANTLAGIDLNPGVADIYARFNASIDNNNNCLRSRNWYYGFDGNAGNNVDLLSVVLHEIGHGLGFSTFVNKYTGSRFMGKDDTYMARLYDAAQGLSWKNMSDSQRQSSMTSPGSLQWNGPSAMERAAIKLNSGVVGDGKVRMYAPAELAPGSSVSHFDTVLSPDELMEPFIGPAVQNLFLSTGLMQDIGWPLFVDVDLELSWVAGINAPMISNKIAEPGKPFTLTLQLANKGDDQASNLVSELRLPSQLMLVSAEGDGRVENNRWHLDQLNGGAKAHLNLQLLAAAPLEQTLEAELVQSGSEDIDSRPNNDLLDEDDQMALTLQVMPAAPVAVNDQFVVSVNQTARLSVLQNDQSAKALLDVDSLELANLPGQASFQVLASGDIQMTPQNWVSGSLVFQYRVKAQNSSLFSNWATVNVDLQNDSAVHLQPDLLQGAEDQTITANLLSNDQGVSGLTAQLLQQPVHGSAQLSSNGSLSYTPESNFYGDDQLTYQVGGQQQQVTIKIAAVNDQPAITTMASQQAVVAEPFNLQLLATDADGDLLSFSSGNLPGWLTLTAAGKLSGTPASSDVGSRQIALQVSDPSGASSSINLQLTVAAESSQKIALTMLSQTTSVSQGASAQHRWLLSNQSDQSLTNVQLDLNIAADITTSLQPSDSCLQLNSSQLRCQLGSLAAGAEEQVAIAVTADQVGDYQLIASAQASGSDTMNLAPWAVKVTALPVIEGAGQGPQQSALTTSVVTRDIDRDGDQDLIILTQAGASSQLVLNQQGGWQQVAQFDIDSDSYDADFARINNQDLLVVANGSGQPNKLYVWQDNQLRLIQLFARADEVESRAVAFVDLDGDGHKDLVFANAMINQSAVASTVYRYVDGEFVYWSSLQTEDAQTLGVADFNNDGWLDIVIAGYRNDWYYPNQGGGENAFTVRHQLPENGYSNQLMVTDMDNDGRNDDLVIARQAFSNLDSDPRLDNGNPIYLFQNGQFSLLKKLGQADSVSLLVEDLNSDSGKEVVFVDRQGMHNLYQTDPQLMLQLLSDLTQSDQSAFSELFTVGSQLFHTENAKAVVSLDYDRDGDNDLVFAAADNGQSDIYLNQGNNQFAAPVQSQGGGSGGGGSLHWLGLLLLAALAGLRDRK